MADPLYIFNNPDGDVGSSPEDILKELQKEDAPAYMLSDALRLKALENELAGTEMLNRRIELLGEVRRLREKIAHDIRDHIVEMDVEEFVTKSRLARIKNPSPVMAHELSDPDDDNLFLVEKGMGRALTRLVRKSHKFVFDTDASIRLGELVQHNPDLLVEAAEFVRPPFDQTWIELDLGYVNVGLGGGEDINKVFLAGILFDNDNIYVAMQTGNESVWLPVCWQLNAGATPDSVFEEMRVDIAQANNFLWGRGPSGDPEIDGMMDRLRTEHRTRFFARQRSGGLVVNNPLWEGVLRSMTAMLPLAMGAAMLLLRPSFTRIIRDSNGQSEGPQQDEPKKPKGYLASTVVTVKLRRETLFKRMISEMKSAQTVRRRHDVRGHYCHNQAAREAPHDHDWEEVMPDHWECKVPGCMGHRWWRRAHERGDGAVGYNTKHYVVKRG